MRLLVDWCSSIVNVALDYCGEEGAELDGKALNIERNWRHLGMFTVPLPG